MKSKLLLLVVFCILLSGLTYAQDEPKRDPNRKIPSAEEMTKKDLDNLKTELTLTDDQVPFIEKVLLDAYTKMQKVFKTQPPDFSQMQTIMEARDNDIKMVLTDEQTTKYTELREKQNKRFNRGNRDD
jgi:hypothetical protein